MQEVGQRSSFNIYCRCACRHALKMTPWPFTALCSKIVCIQALFLCVHAWICAWLTVLKCAQILLLLFLRVHITDYYVSATNIGVASDSPLTKGLVELAAAGHETALAVLVNLSGAEQGHRALVHANAIGFVLASLPRHPAKTQQLLLKLVLNALALQPEKAPSVLQPADVRVLIAFAGASDSDASACELVLRALARSCLQPPLAQLMRDEGLVAHLRRHLSPPASDDTREPALCLLLNLSMARKC